MKDFGKRLHAAMVARDMNQSDLCRKVWGETIDNRGITVARNRDRMSQYIAGRGYPTVENLTKIADALGMKPEELAPEVLQASAERSDDPAVQLLAVNGSLDRVFLKVNVLVTLKTATTVIGLLQEDQMVAGGLARAVPSVVRKSKSEPQPENGSP